jgi:OmpA-OmpF porin, OOP family
MTAMSRFGLGLGLAFAAGTLACAHNPPQSLLVARSTYQGVASDPMVQADAPVPLHEAKQALDRANRAYEDDADSAEVDHLAYLAARRAEIARELAKRTAAQETTQKLGEARSDVLLDARTREAEQARLQAAELARQLADLQAKQTERGIVLTLGDVFFDVDRAELKPGAEHSLERLADFLRQNPDREVAIEGHTDSTGSPEYNLALSERRAEAASRFLESQGIERSRISARGYGLSRPIASNQTVAGRQQNRRVEIVILDAGRPASTGTLR